MQMKSAFARAFALAALAMVAAFGVSPASAQPAPSGDRFQGILAVVWGDPHPAVTGGTTRFTIVYPGGETVPLDVPAELRNQAIQFAGKRVTVRGRASAESGSPRINVDGIEASQVGPQAEAATIGTRKVLFILLRFKNDNQQPHTPAFFVKLTNPLTPNAALKIPATMNAFFNKVSYGKFKWAGTVAGNKWYTLPLPRTSYSNCNGSMVCADLQKIGHHALNLVKNDVNVENFDNINFVLNNDLDCCAWGGTYVNVAGTRSWGATWEPPWGQETGTYVHEMGHSLGLPHSGWRYSAYDSQHDQMSNGSAESTVQCGTYNSVNFGGPNRPIFCSKPGGGFIMAHQNFLGWIPAANKRSHNTVSTKDYVIEANSLALTNRLKMVIVCIVGKPCNGGDNTAARFLTIEVKLHAGDFDDGVPSQGVLIHDVMMNRPPTPADIEETCFFNNQSGWAMPFDAVGGDWNPNTCSGAGLTNMAYGVGKIFNNAALGIKVQVLSKTGNTFKVRVTKSK